MVSTPTLKGHSRSEAAFLDSDRRYFHVPCLHCGDTAPITWARIRWPELGASGMRGLRRHPSRAREASPAGLGRMARERDGRRPHRGFPHLSALYSPWETWAEIAAGVIECRFFPPAQPDVVVNPTMFELTVSDLQRQIAVVQNGHFVGCPRNTCASSIYIRPPRTGGTSCAHDAAARISQAAFLRRQGSRPSWRIRSWRSRPRARKNISAAPACPHCVNRRTKLPPDRRAKLTPLGWKGSGPEPTELIMECRRVRP